MRHLELLSTLFVLAACNGAVDNTGDTVETDTDTDSDTDADTDTDTEPVEIPAACRGTTDGVWTDASGSGHDGVLRGLGFVGDATTPYAVEFPVGPSDSGAGSGTVQFPDPTDLLRPDAFTVEVWAKSATPASYNHILLWFRSSDPTVVSGWALNDSVDLWRFLAYIGGDTSWAYYDVAPRESEWTYIALSFDSAHTSTVRVDDQSTGMDGLLPMVFTPDAIAQLGSPDAAQNWLGQVAVFRYWDRALSADELDGNFTAEAARFGKTGTGTTVPATFDPIVWLDARPCQ